VAHDSFKDDVLNGIYNNFSVIAGTLLVGSFLAWNYFAFSDNSVSEDILVEQVDSSLDSVSSAVYAFSSNSLVQYHSGSGDNVLNISISYDSSSVDSLDRLITSYFGKN